MAYRKSALDEAGGFDERFRRAYREDADLALRLMDRGHRLVRGGRRVSHPVRPAGYWASVRAQAGNADDALMRRIHGRRWRTRAHAPHGALRRHLGVTVAALAALRWPRLAAPAWLGLTAWFAAERIAPGPRTATEIARMLVTSVAIPPVAVAHRVRGEIAARAPRPAPPAAVLFDRDGTLVRDVPYNRDPGAVAPMPGARAALDRLRRRGVPVGVVTNQSGVGRGLIDTAELTRVNTRVEELLGPFDVWEICPHDPAAAGCRCRKPAPLLIERAAAALGVPAARCVVIGDIGGDVAAARAAGARGILVPSPATRPEEVRAAPEVAADLGEAVDMAIAGTAAWAWTWEPA
jgi:HAD superfamily hydrolase (TIGR01662 family)